MNSKSSETNRASRGVGVVCLSLNTLATFSAAVLIL